MGFTTGMVSGLEMRTPHYYIDDDGICTDCEACQQGLDVAFAMDYTGSMGSIIESVKSGVDAIATTIDSLVDPANKYRLTLQLTDEAQFTPGSTYPTNNGGWYGSNYPNTTIYAGLPALQKFQNVSPNPPADYGSTQLRQLLTTMEVFQDNNLTTFKAQLAKTNDNQVLPAGFGLGWGIQSPEPYDMSIDRMVDGLDGVGAWRKGITRIGMTFADNKSSGDDDNFSYSNPGDDRYFLMDDLSSKCRINNIRWMRFGPYSDHTLWGWRELGVRTDGTNNNSYNTSVVNAAIVSACGRGEVPYRMVDSNEDLKTFEWTPYSWDCGITTAAVNKPHYLDIADHNDFTINPTTGITFSIWIKPTHTFLTNQKFLHKTGEYEIGTDSSDKLFFSVTTNNGTLKITTTTSPLVTDNWQHVLCTWDGSFANSNGMEISWAAGDADGVGATHTVYSVGNSNVSDDSTGSTGTSITNTTNNIQSGDNSPTTAGYNGLISDIAIYKNVLSTTQAALVLNGGRPQNLHSLWNDIDVDWLVGYWRPFSPETTPEGTGAGRYIMVYGWESKNAIYFGDTVGESWSTDTPSNLGQ